MSEGNESRNYESFKIPHINLKQNNGFVQPRQKSDTQPASALTDGTFYEIEYDSSPYPGVGKLVQKSKPQKIIEPENNEIRELFSQMRNISREYRSAYDYSRFYDRHNHNSNSVIFYRQALFMKDFTDDYSDVMPLNQYFPYYQMLGYEQLRTYFTWRTKVRDGIVSDTSISYAYLYIYELLCNIGADTPQDGLDKLMFFWKAFSEYNNSISKYILRWLKDYHIYYELPHTFIEFVDNNGLAEHYPKLTNTDDDFDLYCSISKYDIRKSRFFADHGSQMITDCFSFVISKIRQDFEAGGIRFDDALFRPTRKLMTWKPFKDALFHNPHKQPDRKVVFSENEIYICRKGVWIFSSIITTEKGKQFIGYVMKQIEATLRQITKYKYKLTANISMVNEETLRVLTNAGIFIDKIVPAAVYEYHREATKTIVTVDHASLKRIREEALHTQNALIVEDEQNATISVLAKFEESNQDVFADTTEPKQDTILNIWESLKDSLDENELQALSVIINNGDLKSFADKCGIMLEVLVDGVNEKAMDSIGDNLLDEDFALYDDYSEQVKEMINI